jgi:hypothetical protein
MQLYESIALARHAAPQRRQVHPIADTSIHALPAGLWMAAHHQAKRAICEMILPDGER